MYLFPLHHTSARIDRSGAESFPDDCLTDVGCNKERDTRAQTVAFLKQLIQQQDNQTRDKQLQKQTGDLYRVHQLCTTSMYKKTKYYESHTEAVRVWIF